MSLGAMYTTYPADNFAAAFEIVHKNLSGFEFEDASEEASTATRAILHEIIHALGAPVGAAVAEERIMSLRESNLGHGEALNRIWRTMYGNRQPSHSNYDMIADDIIHGLESKMPPPDVTDAMVNEVALGAFGPSVVYDRERLRSALAKALQTR